jgi:hypothetical protein
MENIEKFRILHHQYNFSKAFTLEYFKLGEEINKLNLGNERNNKIEELHQLLHTYNFNFHQLSFLKSENILLKLYVTDENYQAFVNNETLFDADFGSPSFSEIKQEDIHNQIQRDLKKELQP